MIEHIDDDFTDFDRKIELGWRECKLSRAEQVSLNSDIVALWEAFKDVLPYYSISFYLPTSTLTWSGFGDRRRSLKVIDWRGHCYSIKSAPLYLKKQIQESMTEILKALRALKQYEMATINEDLEARKRCVNEIRCLQAILRNKSEDSRKGA